MPGRERRRSAGECGAMSTTPRGNGDLGMLLAAFDAFCARARQRLVDGHQVYRDQWRRRDNLAALQEESADAFVYGFFDWLKAQARRNQREEVSEG